MENEEDLIRYVGCNVEKTCFTLITETSFMVYNADPVRFCFRREFPGNLGLVEILDRSNIFALTGGGAFPRFPLNKVII